MVRSTDWTKISVISGIVLGIPTLMIAVLSYIRPPDPLHPMRLDFLSKSISIPFWFAVSTLLFLAVLVSVIVRLKFPKRVDEKNDKAKIVMLRDRVSELEREKKDSVGQVEESMKIQSLITDDRSALLSLFDKQPEEQNDIPIFVSSPDDFSVQIELSKTSENTGVILKVANNRLSWIDGFTLTVPSVQSFDTRHKDYRDNPRFSNYLARIDGVIEASGISQGTWLIRSDEAKRLFLGEDNQRPLNWPSNDPEILHRWRILFSIDTATLKTPTDPARSLQRLTASLVITWSKTNNVLTVDEYQSYI